MKYSYEAIIFDLDGVLTQTARVHFDAWKRVFDEFLSKRGLPEFTKSDYTTFVDGRPRYNGIENFLKSRSIDLPKGETDDEGLETVYGIGNIKNKHIQTLIAEADDLAFPYTKVVLQKIRDAGIKVGLMTSSKNGYLILDRAVLTDMFDAIVTGIEIESTGLTGKPEGDAFMACAEKLGVEPEKAIVVEDAVSGLWAGRNGEFQFVVGVARNEKPEIMLRQGADIVVDTIEHMDLDMVERLFINPPRPFFDCFDSNDDKACRVMDATPKSVLSDPFYWETGKTLFFKTDEKPVFFLDYDGTLTPIVDTPESAVLSEDMRDTIRALNERYTVAVVSGRAKSDVQQLVGIPELYYAGSHGFEISAGDKHMVIEEAEKLIPHVKTLTDAFKEKTAHIDGALVEPKKFSLALHYRLVKNEEDVKLMRDLAREYVRRYHGFKILNGKKVFEIMPDILWNKGKALRWMMEAGGIDWDGNHIVYVGDDITDEFAFRTVRGRGTGIVVSENEERNSAAMFRLKNTDEVLKFFNLFLP